MSVADHQLSRLISDDRLYCERNLKIRTKDGEIRPFVWNDAQVILHEKLEGQLAARLDSRHRTEGAAAGHQYLRCRALLQAHQHGHGQADDDPDAPGRRHPEPVRHREDVLRAEFGRAAPPAAGEQRHRAVVLQTQERLQGCHRGLKARRPVGHRPVHARLRGGVLAQRRADHGGPGPDGADDPRQRDDPRSRPPTA